MLAALLGCTGSPNYWNAYTPMHAQMANTSRPAAVQRAVIALTDAGREIESSDVSTGIVLSRWWSGDGFGHDDTRFRVRVIFDESTGYTVEALCQRKGMTSGDFTDQCDDAKRPQFVLDVMAKVDTALRRT